MQSWQRWTYLLSMIGVVVLAARWRASAAEETGGERAANARIADVAWIAGTWRGEDGSDRLEERWSEPLGDGMVGTFRWLRSDAVWMYELMTITEDDGLLVFRIKHFTRTLKGWEPQDEPVSYPLAQFERGKVVFENPAHDAPRRFMYERTAPDRIMVSFESIKDGATKRQDFSFKRVGS